MPGDEKTRGIARFLPLLLAGAALLPNPGAALPLDTYFFRDIALLFIPLRLFQAQEIAAGGFPFWNPYSHEGEFMIPSFYPPDLLLALWPTPEFISWVLTLHLPLAALGAYALARSRGMGRTAAFTTGGVYALGGFALSTLNLYFFLQVLALAPVILLALERAATRGGRWIAAAALLVATGVSTMGVELLLQAIALAALLALWRDAAPAGKGWTPALRIAGALALAAGVAAVPIAIVIGFLPETARGMGLAATESGGLALPPMGLLQLVLPSVFGTHERLLETFWGDIFFKDGFPYLLSVYLGGLVLCLAALGAARAPRREGVMLVAALAFGLWYALGPSGGLWNLMQMMPSTGAFRFPVKSVFVAHFAAALLAGRGIDSLERGTGWRAFGAMAAVAGLAIFGVAAAGWAGHEAIVRWLGLSDRGAKVFAAAFPADAALTGVIVLLGAGIAAAARFGRLPPATAAALLAGLITLDLARAGVGINKQVPAQFFQLHQGLAAQHLDRLDGGRVFSYPSHFSARVEAWLATRPPGVESWLFYAIRQGLNNHANMLDRIEGAASGDSTGLIPQFTSLHPGAYDPKYLGEILPKLRHAAVSRVLSFDPIAHPDLNLLAAIALPPPGLEVYVYRIAEAWPRAFVACRAWAAGDRVEAAEAPLAPGFDPRRDVAFESAMRAEPQATGCNAARILEVSRGSDEERFVVESDGPGWLVSRATHARGWHAVLDGAPAELRRADGRHRAVAVPAGRHEVLMRYQPPGLRIGIVLSLVSLAALLWLALRRKG